MTFIRQDNEKVVVGPEKMVTVPPRHYCVVENPVVRDADDNIVYEASKQVKLRHADSEIRLAQDPFPLYPGEFLKVCKNMCVCSCVFFFPSLARIFEVNE
jgi:major vault protein